LEYWDLITALVETQVRLLLHDVEPY